MRWRRNRENGNRENGNRENGNPPPDPAAEFWNSLNVSMGYMEPAERKVLNEARQACAEYGLSFTDALSIYLAAPTALPVEVLWRFRRADEIL